MKQALFTLLMLQMSSMTLAQDEALIYGKVTTLDKQVYVGHFRWGGEETFWSDHFNASKLDTRVFGHLIEQRRSEEDEDDGWFGLDWSLKSIWEDRHGSVHEFVCEFGNIVSIQYVDRNKMKMKLKNGSTIKVGGSGYNDVRASIRMFDDEIGNIKIDGDRVYSVEFSSTPKKLRAKSGNALYGSVVTTHNDSIVGFIQWDHDERLSTEKLDGENRGEDLSIEFGNIAKVEARRRSSLVTLNSGREFVLSGSNDVDEDNNGIIVTVEGLGRVDIPWSNVEYVSFDHSGTVSGLSYDGYKSPRGLKGEVRTVANGDHSGQIVFDMDEVWEFEMLDGNSNGLNFKIPFKHIRSITPKNYNYSWVELKGGKRILLGGSRDVSDDNDGLVVFKDKKEDPVRIRWTDVDQITFD